MSEFGPFESKPHIAVALSGGRDSTALLWLAKQWTNHSQGKLSALIVDHGLRPESADEALRASEVAADIGVGAHILAWRHPPLESRVEESARAARYELLDRACERLGILHLLVGHHLDDQIETIALRMERKSGERGRAGMSGIRELSACRILRPLLIWSRSRIAATLFSSGLRWIDDPTNQSDRFWRSKYRRLGERNAPPSKGLAQRRRYQDAEQAEALAHTVLVDPFGYLAAHRRSISECSKATQELILADLVATVGGCPYRRMLPRPIPPASDLTFGGTLVTTRDRWLAVLREPKRVKGVMTVAPGGRLVWDGRFVIDNRNGLGKVMVSPASSSGRRSLSRIVPFRPATVAAGVPNLNSPIHIYFGALCPLTSPPFTP